MWIYCSYCDQSGVQGGVFCVCDTEDRCPNCGRPTIQEGVVQSPLTLEKCKEAGF